MTLIKSISGIRGTIGGEVGSNLTPVDIMKFTAAFATWVKSKSEGKPKIVVGRDSRLSGDMVLNIVRGTLISVGADIVDIGPATTPTTEIAVVEEKANGGIIITASHNPKQWNALKLLGSNGEFLSDKEGKEVLSIAEAGEYEFVDIDSIGKLNYNYLYDSKHVDMVAALPLVDVAAIRAANFAVAIDCVNSVGGVTIPKLLVTLGVKKILPLNCDSNGNFAHNPEPIPENLTQISELCKRGSVSVGFVVDPDVDRLAIICEDGEMFGEEYTLVSVADYVLSHTPGNTVSNLSSTRALRDVTRSYGCEYNASAVGEVNVVAKMKETNAIIGGEGNGGVIYPALHYGRDAFVGIALFLTMMAKTKLKPSQIKAKYPSYFISKNRIDLTPDVDVDAILAAVKERYKNEEVNDIDGVKIDFADKWVHLRKSNTEPIIRVYSEAKSEAEANEIAQSVIDVVKSLV